MKGLLLVFTFFVLLNFLQAQSVTKETDDYVIEEVLMPEGRLGNNVNAIVQGPNGFVWFGSHAGLHRFDGYEFITYKKIASDTLSETTSLTFPYVENLYWDREGMLWVCSYGGGIFRFDPKSETFKNFKHDPKDSATVSNPFVTCAIEDADGNLWFGTEHGLNRFDRKTETFKRYRAIPGNTKSLYCEDIRSLYVDKKGVLWIGSGFFFYAEERGALSQYNASSDSFINYVQDTNDVHTLWGNSVRGMLEDSRGNFWVGTDRGLSRLNRTTGVFEWMENDPNLPHAPGELKDNAITYSIHEDKLGGLWIGSMGEADKPSHLIRYDTITRKSKSLPIQSSAWALTESNEGTLWVAGAGGGGGVGWVGGG
jgi:ligand-binding sensor domain-containing protein